MKAIALGLVVLLSLGLAAPGIITHGTRGQHRIALTFDADMTPGMEQLLKSGRVKSYDNTGIYALLNQTQTKATFFLSGLWIETYPQETWHLAQNPLFELENHSYSHPGFAQPCFGLSRILDKDKRDQILKSKSLLKQVAGVENHYFRFPGGCANPGDVTLAEQAGLKVVRWDVIGGDGGQSNPKVIERNVLSQVRDGSIIVLHSQGGPKVPATVDALQVILPALKARGFEFVKLSELLGG